MIPGWDERVAFVKNRSWQDNQFTRELTRVVGADFAVVIWDQFGRDSFDWLNGDQQRVKRTLWCRLKNLFNSMQPLKGRLMFFVCPGKLVTPLERLQSKDGRIELMRYFFNPWRD